MHFSIMLCILQDFSDISLYKRYMHHQHCYDFLLTLKLNVGEDAYLKGLSPRVVL